MNKTQQSVPSHDDILLKLEGVTKAYETPSGSLAILNGVDFQASAGQKIYILGPSGSGKSTFLHIAGLLDSPTSGNLFVENKAVDEKLPDQKRAKLRLKTFGFVYQHHYLMENFTALENVLMPSRILSEISLKEAELQAKILLEEVGLSARLNHFPSQLSGGEQQRVALARALMNNPKILLADEPTGNLDSATAKEVEALVDHFIQQKNMALVMVTHNEKLAQKGDVVYRMNKGTLVKQ